jgi:hypothetical protein
VASKVLLQFVEAQHDITMFSLTVGNVKFSDDSPVTGDFGDETARICQGEEINRLAGGIAKRHFGDGGFHSAYKFKRLTAMSQEYLSFLFRVTLLLTQPENKLSLGCGSTTAKT